MTDTPTDTAPEAITQAGYTADDLALATSLMNAGRMASYEAGARDIARHRRLTSHSAGEGLLWSDPLKLGSDTWERPAWLPADALLKHANGREGRASSWAFGPTSEFSIALVSTPPSDAGSTTRSGGEGVNPMTDREVNWLVHQLEAWPTRVDPDRTTNITFLMQEAAKVIRRTPLATTPSPDASPDSGEACDWPIERDSDGEAMVCTGCGTTRTLDHIRYLSPAALSCCPERKMIPVRDALRLAASPASLSGGAEEAVLAGRAVLAGEGDGTYDEACDAIRQLIAAIPSPEAPANRQEAAEVERRRGQEEGFAAAVAQLRDMSAIKPRATLYREAGILADRLEQSRVALSASNAAQVSK